MKSGMTERREFSDWGTMMRMEEGAGGGSSLACARETDYT